MKNLSSKANQNPFIEEIWNTWKLKDGYPAKLMNPFMNRPWIYFRFNVVA